MGPAASIAPAIIPAPSPMPLFLSVLLLSAAALAYELLLMRLFSIVQWHHFAYMVISLALLGYAASGTLIALFRRHLLRRFIAGYLGGSLLFGLGSVAAFAVAQRLPFNPLRLAWDPGQLLPLAGLYLLLAVPFLGAGGAIGLALARFGDRIHRLYRADLLGAGLGAASIVGLLFLLPPEACLRWVGALAIVAAGVAAWDRELGRRRGLGALLLVAGLASPFLWPRDFTALRISEFKGLTGALEAPESRVVAERSSPLGSISVVSSPRIPFRHAPGLSLAFPGELPEQLGVFTDADSLSVISRFRGDREELLWRDYLTSALPYHLLERPRVLVVGAGGGAEVLTAIHHRAREIDAVEVDRRMAALLSETFADFAGGLYRRPEVRLVRAEARSFLARGNERYDLVQVALVDSFAAAAAGTHALAESYLYTVEAVEEMLQHLAPGGLLAFTRWLDVPPRDALKLLATAVEALERSGVERPGEHLALIRSWNTATLLVKRGALEADELAALRRFCSDRSFDVAWYPGMGAGEANRYNLLDRPFLWEGARALLGPQRQRFLEHYKFHIVPATDDRPYFFRFFRWRTLPELLRLRGRGGTPLIEWSYLVLVATLAQVVVAGGVLVLLPVAAAAGRRLRVPGTTSVGVYFLALGLAFLCVEIALIQRLALFLGHPLYAAAVVLGSFLAFAGLGSGMAPRLTGWIEGRAPRGPLRRLPALSLPAGGAALLTALYAIGLTPLLRSLVHLPDAARVTVAVAGLAPLAFLMGMPFPLGLARAAQRHAPWVPWAWAVNGWASVVSAVLATLLGVHLGFTAVLAVGAALYGVAAATARRL